MKTGVAHRPVVRHDAADPRTEPNAEEDALAVEEPLEIRLGGVSLAVTMRTPGHDEELAAGFCLTEAVIDAPDQLASVQPCSLADYGNVVDVELEAGSQRPDPVERARRELFVSSSCGLCGKQSIDRVRQVVPPLAPGPEVGVDTLRGLSARMREAQSGFDATGGLHAAGLFEVSGELRVLREDVGRHNAVDKVIGHEVLLGRTPLRNAVLLVSGRASFEIVQKAGRAGLAVVCAVSAPSTLAVDLATELDLTLVAFLRGERMNVYHDPGRLR